MRSVFVLVVYTLLAGCAGQTELSTRPGLEIRGTVTWIELEGGFWAIRGDDNKVYEPINLHTDYQVEGLPVTLRASMRRDRMSTRMAGPIIEIHSIRRR
ncbi:MAG: hypothetical protein HBSIN02_17510 [Bacteroidia bacterium]|nr:MAG: hypothetical protein HBSIN02_17510 [Bacteroidia bacterium]